MKIVIWILFVFVAVTVPAHASTIQWDLQNITGNNGQLAVTGFFDYDTTTTTIPNYDFTISGTFPNGMPLNISISPYAGSGPPSGFIVPSVYPFQNAVYVSDFGGELQITLATGHSNIEEFLAIQNAGATPLTTGSSVFSIPYDGYSYIGSVAITTGQISPTPLPTSLPLFGSALLGLIGFAALRMRRLSDVTR